ncbi:MAG TPA: MATE family efflux transporter [Armatimonadota bacterium]|jgi:putative MATE family efflux protein
MGVDTPIRDRDDDATGDGQTVVTPADGGEPSNMRHEVWQLAWPTIIANVLMNVGGLINLYFVHGLGVGSMNAVTWGEQMIGIVFAVAVGVSIGTTALVARSIGAGDERSAADATRQSLMLGIILGVFTTAVLALLERPVLLAMGANHSSLPLGLIYYHWLLFGIVPFFLINVCGAAFRGAGDTRTPLYLLTLLVGVSVLTDSTLIWGFGPIPKMGVAGAGLGTFIMRSVGSTAFLVALWRSPHRLITASDSWRLDLGWAKRLIRVGFPAGLQAGLRTIASSTFVGLLARMQHGPAVVAALSVGLRSEGIAFMPGMAFNVAAAALVGQSLGARNPNRAARAARAATLQAIWIMALMGATFFVFAPQMAKALAAPEAVPFAVAYLRIAAISEPFLAVAMTLTGALQGAGDTMKPMWVVINTMLLRLATTWYFGLHLGLGANAAWWAMSGSTCVQGLLILAAWRRGTWRRVRV